MAKLLPSVLAVVAFLGCSAPAEEEVVVFAASSLTESFTRLGEILEQREDAEVTFNFASSSALQIQISEGAPADVFASADPAQMEVLVDEHLAQEPELFAGNRLAVVTPVDDPARITRVQDIARPGVRLVLAAPEVPAGAYAREAFRLLGLSDEVEANVVSNEEDVKQVLAKVSLGEADAGVVYVTDVTDDVRSLELPSRAQVEIDYPIAVVEGSDSQAAARAFVELVLSEEGSEVLSEFGFEPPDG